MWRREVKEVFRAGIICHGICEIENAKMMASSCPDFTQVYWISGSRTRGGGQAWIAYVGHWCPGQQSLA